MRRPSTVGKSGWILLILLIMVIPCTVSAASAAASLTITVKDVRTRETLDRAQVYVDGGYRGDVGDTAQRGELIVQNVSPGVHTVRVTREGYTEGIRRVQYPAQERVEVFLNRSPLVFLGPGFPSAKAFTVIFYPSSTTYRCTDKSKIPTPIYLTNETKFREDVNNVIHLTYKELNLVTSATDPLPQDYENRFNFYYYYDPAAPADAFAGCSGTIPGRYWDEITFSDVTVILYPTYYGKYTDSACQPVGCTQETGTGHMIMKVPADQPMLLKHETGHAVFGLIDTYCGDTHYYQNEPYPNVWESGDACTADARKFNRDPGMCRQIQKNDMSTRTCIRNFWQWDPVPDIMANGYSGTFGPAATQRINYILSKIGV